MSISEDKLLELFNSIKKETNAFTLTDQEFVWFKLGFCEGFDTATKKVLEKERVGE